MSASGRYAGEFLGRIHGGLAFVEHPFSIAHELRQVVAKRDDEDLLHLGWILRLAQLRADRNRKFTCKVPCCELERFAEDLDMLHLVRQSDVVLAGLRHELARDVDRYGLHGQFDAHARSAAGAEVASLASNAQLNVGALAEHRGGYAERPIRSKGSAALDGQRRNALRLIALERERHGDDFEVRWRELCTARFEGRERICTITARRRDPCERDERYETNASYMTIHGAETKTSCDCVTKLTLWPAIAAAYGRTPPSAPALGERYASCPREAA